MTEEIIIQRLSLIKHLYLTGVEQSEQPETIAYSSIMLFHDSIDMFMQLVSEKKGIKIKDREKIYLMDFFTKIPELKLEPSIKKINDRRNSLKHNGQIPAKIEINECKIIAKLFFEENTSIIFGIDFNEVSLFNLIPYTSVREYLEKAKEFKTKKEYKNSLEEIAKAFYELETLSKSILKNIHTHNKYGQKDWNFITPTMKKDWSFFIQNSFSDSNDLIPMDISLAVLNHSYKSNFLQIQSWLNALSIGVDFRKYTFFRKIVPEVVGKVDDKLFVSPISEIANLSEEKIDFAMKFVVDFSFKLQEFQL